MLSFSGALSKDNTSTLKVFFGVVLVIIVVSDTGRSGGAC